MGNIIKTQKKTQARPTGFGGMQMKGILALVLALAMTLGAAGALAAEYNIDNVVIDGTAAGFKSNEPIILGENVKTATFQNVTVSGLGYDESSYPIVGKHALVVNGDSVKLYFEGVNSLTGGSVADNMKGIGGRGIYAAGSIEIVVRDGGSLSATGGSGGTGESGGTGGDGGIGVHAEGNVTIGGTVTANGVAGQNGGEGGSGVYARGNVTISGGTVTANGGFGGDD